MRTVASMLLLAVAPHMGAQAASSSDEEDIALYSMSKSTISLATGSQQLLRRAPAVATVITSDDIAAMGATDLDQVLETVAGFHVTRAGPVNPPNYIIRGIGGGGPANPQVLVLLNGMRMNTDFNGDKGNMWVSFPLTNVARIEIIRGPGSALYGADAFAGVINIITKTVAQMQGLRTGGIAGSFRTLESWVEYGSNHGPLGIAAYLQLGTTAGAHSVIEADAQTLNDRRFGTKVSLAPGGMNLSHDSLDASVELAYKNWRWRNSVKWRGNVGMGSGVNSALDPRHRTQSGNAITDLSWTDDDFAEGWGMGASLSYMLFTEQSPEGLGLFPPGARIGANVFPDGMIGGPFRWERNLRASAYATYSGWRQHLVRAGVGHDDMNLYKVHTFKNFMLTPAGVPVPTGPVINYDAIQPHIKPQRRNVDYVYVQDEWQFAPDWALTAGVRHDRDSSSGGTTNPRLALVWDASLDVTAKLLHGRAFRAPSFNEQSGINPVNNGNPDLRPEKIHTTEGVLSWQVQPDLNVNLSLFRYAMTDIIRTVPNPAPAPGASYQNVGSVKGKGGEVELVWDITRNVHWEAGYARQHAIDQGTKQDPGYAPRHHANSRLDWRFGPDWSISPQLNWVAGRRRAPGDARAPIADYRTFDTTLMHHAASGWTVSASVRNLFNADAREPSQAPGLALPFDIPVYSRALVVQLSGKW
ncbi:TonB-dependent receptor [Duganella sp. FT92W]|uniref:TonB-dependent receptor n=2 Tax=Pseudoduganella rivuli TaxID=2666085 RepID=A0A7X2LSK2_9BURK|nr:TonB-dependent receptor [Pseudoduganella rivuli]